MRFSKRIVMIGGMLLLVGLVGFSWSPWGQNYLILIQRYYEGTNDTDKGAIDSRVQEQQQSRSRSDFSRSRSGGSLLELVKNPEVQKSLNLSEDEQAFLAPIEEERRNDVSWEEFVMGLWDLSSEEQSRMMREYYQSRNEEVENRINQVIGPSRFERLKQIRFQLAGVRILFDSRTTNELGITDQQLEQFGVAEQKVEEELRNLRREKHEQRAKAIFTPEQKKQWSKRKGVPIDFTIERR